MSTVMCESCGWQGYGDQLAILRSITVTGLATISADPQNCSCPQCGDHHIFYKPAGMVMNCKILQQNDEYACSKCGMRWDVGEEAPPCERGQIENRITGIEMTGKPAGCNKAEYRELKSKLKELNK